VLFTGDIEHQGGLDLVNEYCPRARNRCRKLNSHIVKIPHHGSAHLSPRFVQLVAPDIVLISAGHRNRQYHHPRVSALRAYADFGATEFYSTSAEGRSDITIRIESDGTITRPDTPPAQTFTAWIGIDSETECLPANVSSGFCVLSVPQGAAP
jgi:beta-lactamase superfamily II metal-dependent hydrolase